MGKQPLWRLAVVVGLGVAVLTPMAANAAGVSHYSAEDQNTVSPGVSYNVTTKVPRQFTGPGLTPPLDPSIGGSWQVVSYASPVRSVHAVLLNTGKVLLSAGSGNDPATFAAGQFTAIVWDPVAGTFSQQLPLPWDMFCSGHTALPDGRILISGGTIGYQSATSKFKGSNQTYIFDPATETFSKGPTMTVGRWYPTTVERGDGTVAIVGGADANGNSNYTQELYTPPPATNPTDPGTLTTLPRQLFSEYSNIVLLGDGRLFFSGQATGMGNAHPGIWNLVNNKFQAIGGLTNTSRRHEGTTVLLPPAQNQVVLTMGGGTPGIVDTNLVNLTTATPQYTAGPNLPAAKMELNASILPDSTVLETGGGTNRGKPVWEASVYQPASNQFVEMNQPHVGRTYHSESVLLPDGRVAELGGNPTDSQFEMSIEIFSPPYLFKGTRPAITAAPGEIHYGGSYDVSANAAAGSTLTSAELVRPSAVTHSTDPDQRLVDLTATPSAAGLSINVPANANLAPPGWYMLFVNDSVGRPSIASWVHLS